MASHLVTSVPSPGAISRPRRQAGASWSLLASSLAFFLIILDTMLVSIALPAIERDAGGGLQGQQWVLNSYAIAFAGFLLLCGTVCDRVGAKRAMLLGLGVFAAASAAAAFTPSLGVLIAARAVEGFGAALMLPASMALVREAFPDASARARAVGLWAIGGAVAVMVGSSVGGVVSDLGWRWVFAVNVPICLLGGLMLLAVPRSSTRYRRFDVIGQVLAVIGLGSLIFALVRSGSDGFTSPWVIGGFAAAGISLLAFVLVERRVTSPMLPTMLFARRAMRIAFLFSFTFMFSWFGCIVAINLYLQDELGLSALSAGLVFLPSAVVSALANLACGPLVNRLGIRTTSCSGLIVMVAGLVGLVFLAPAADLVWLAVAVAAVGGGGALASPAMTTLVLTNASIGDTGVATGAFNTFRQVGAAVAVAVFGLLIAVPGEYTTGVQWSFAIAAGGVLFTLVAALCIRPSDELREQTPARRRRLRRPSV